MYGAGRKIEFGMPQPVQNGPEQGGGDEILYCNEGLPHNSNEYTEKTLTVFDYSHSYVQYLCLCLANNKQFKGVQITHAAVDSCSTKHVTLSLELCNTLGKLQASAIGSLGGVNSDNPAPVAGAVYKATILLPTTNGGVAQAHLDEILHVPTAPCTILSGEKMWAHNGWRVRAEDTNEVLIPGGDKLQMSRHNGLPTVKMYAATDEGHKNADFGTLIATRVRRPS